MQKKEKTQRKPKKKGKVTSRERLHVLRDLFLKVMWPLLESQGFVMRPFDSWWWEWNPGVQGYDYETVRLRKNYLDYVSIYIPQGGRHIQITFQVIELSEEIKSLQDITMDIELSVDIGNSRKNDYMYPNFSRYGTNRIHWNFFGGCYKLKRYFTRRGFNRRVEQLKRSLIRNFSDLEPTVAMWMKRNKPNILNVKEMKIEETE